MIKINKKKGILFWITGISGSGKSTLGKKIFKNINKIYGETIILHGDDIRNIFQIKKYSYEDRLKLALSYSKMCRKITNQNVNVIFTTVSMFHKVRNFNVKNIENYVEIFVKTNLDKIILNNKKKLYQKKNKKNIVGIDINIETPKNPSITLVNDFSKNLDFLSIRLLERIKKNIKK